MRANTMYQISEHITTEKDALGNHCDLKENRKATETRSFSLSTDLAQGCRSVKVKFTSLNL